VTAPQTQSDRLATLAALGEPLRRSIYLFVTSRSEPVTRDETAERFHVPRAVAAFHLDKLADIGLLDVDFKRPPGRTGPGAGRPTKRYRSTTRDVAFSVPPREYELAGRLLAEAVTVSQRDGIPLERALDETSHTVGRSLGSKARDQVVEGEQLVEGAWRVLRDCGYEPRRDGTDVTLTNCPFHSLAQDYRDLVCGLNLALMSGLVDEIPGSRLEARLDPQPGQCCVRLVGRRGRRR
jgi:predicted ArsR family transcriptional regulator